MNNVERFCRRTYKRHAEAFFILAFILTDCYVSGWALTAGSLAAIVYVFMPAAVAIKSLTPAAQTAYLKAFVKTEKVQKLGFVLLWMHTVRWLISATTTARLFNYRPGEEAIVPVPSALGALMISTQQNTPLALLASPIAFYLMACFAAILMRFRLKASKQDTDLVKQRQNWTQASHFVFTSAFVASILSINLNVHGPAYMIANWLLASARDANFYDSDFDNPSMSHTQALPNPFDSTTVLPVVDTTGQFSNLSFVPFFDTFVIASLSIVLFLLLMHPVMRLNTFLTSFCWRVVSPKSFQNIVEAFLEALRLPARSLTLKEANPFWNNAAKTFLWLVACFLLLFWLFGFCGGPLGHGIQSWMVTSAVDAGFYTKDGAPEWLYSNKFRIFLGSIAALYGCAPVAVMSLAFLPDAKPKQIVINCDGLSFTQGPFISLLGRQFRLWSDLKSFTVKPIPSKNNELKAKFTLNFRSRGHLSFNQSQVSAQDVKVLLDGIDQYASACAVDHQVFDVCNALLEKETDSATSDGIGDTAIESIPAQEFKSTLFVPLNTGEFLPNTQIRIIKQLATKPLCAVYLARNEDGRMVTVKQFYLTDETDESKALTKIFERELEFLSGLDHPQIAKVLNSFTAEKSTFLVLEHRLGKDMRAIVKEHGARPENLTKSWAEQLCQIMIYLHNQTPAIIHRDLTPDNVIVGADGQLRLIDFGAAREFVEGITGTMIGKHCYMAPEQLRGEATHKSDIYSFGGSLYFLLTGRDPVALSQSSPAKVTACSEELDELIRNCTEFDEEKRPQSFAEILERLKNLDNGLKISLPRAKEKAKA